jgi:hypothetical protein
MERDILNILLTNSDALFKKLTRSRQTAEKYLLGNLAALREAYLGRDLSNIGLMPSRENPADGLTKRVGNDALLRILRTRTITFTAVDWFIEYALVTPLCATLVRSAPRQRPLASASCIPSDSKMGLVLQRLIISKQKFSVST